MKIKVNEATRYSDVASFISLLDLAPVTEAALAHFKVATWWELSIEKFCSLCAGEWSAIGVLTVDLTLFEWAVIEDFKKFAGDFTALLEKIQVPASIDEKNATSGLPKQTLFENMAIFVRRYFGLKSFREAGDVTLDEYLIARTDDYRTRMAEKRLIEAQRKKINRIK